MLGIFTHVFREFQLSFLDVSVESWNILREIGWLTNDKLVQNSAYSIKIALFPSSFLAQHFWREICWTSTETFCFFIVRLFTQTEVC